ncbi:NirD/YgiW/YdeI family stress tolerance protein [Algihabitans albus]|uniref:NirD/YgiW/YdeI family stress tolerance protein n=1 Tax=Algihabitans albus TaxID=2164067 RepID=UPI000E5C78A2|nr:NirD/YgiW/YdeI family stress tolerance protein [Algihabitans albus]
MKYAPVAALLATLVAPPALADRITAIADTQRGTMVTVQGTVERITDEDEFRLADATGSIRIYVGPNWVPADVGETVTVSGFVDDDFVLPREIYARSLTRADGTIIAFERRYE